MAKNTSHSPLLLFALELAYAAAQEIRPRFYDHTVQIKDDGSVVTNADRSAERLIRGLIQDTYPSHGILGEEGDEVDGEGTYQWVIDPIDGTRCFTLGVPKFGTLIGLVAEGEPLLGVIHQPMTGESLYAEAAGGCWYSIRDQEPEQVWVRESVKGLEEATISLSGVEFSELRNAPHLKKCQLGTLIHRAGNVEFIGDCIQHTLVSRGRVDAALDSLMYPWDTAAIVPCVIEAGGIVSTIDGMQENILEGGSLLSSCNFHLHEQILRLIHD